MAEKTSTTLPSSVEDFLKRFGQRIAVLRKEKGMTQEELARKIKVDPVYVAYLEGAKRSPSFETIYRLSVALEVKPPALFEG